MTAHSVSLLGEMTWPNVDADRSKLLVVPLGSLEQHGPHLPLATDSLVADTLANRLAVVRSDVVIAPTLAIGASGEHAGFAGTLSIGTPVLTNVLVEIVRSARPSFGGVVIVSGHGGNADALHAATQVADEEGDVVIAFSPRLPGADAHAGRTETSLMLALFPGLVRQDEAVPGVTIPLDELSDTLRRSGVQAVSSSGVLGDPTGATPEEGQRLLNDMVRQLVDAVELRFPR